MKHFYNIYLFIFSCIDIGDATNPVYVLKSDTEIYCWQSYHVLFLKNENN